MPNIGCFSNISKTPSHPILFPLCLMTLLKPTKFTLLTPQPHTPHHCSRSTPRMTLTMTPDFSPPSIAHFAHVHATQPLPCPPFLFLFYHQTSKSSRCLLKVSGVFRLTSKLHQENGDTFGNGLWQPRYPSSSRQSQVGPVEITTAQRFHRDDLHLLSRTGGFYPLRLVSPTFFCALQPSDVGSCGSRPDFPSRLFFLLSGFYCIVLALQVTGGSKWHRLNVRIPGSPDVLLCRLTV